MGIGKAVLLLAILFFGIRFLRTGTERDRRIRLLGAQSDLLNLRLCVLKYRDSKGSLPATLADLLSVRGAAPPTSIVEFDRPREERIVDGWRRPLRFAKDPDGEGFSIRCAGPDGDWDTADDLVEKGRVGEDPKPVFAQFKAHFTEYNALLDEKARLHRPEWWDEFDR